MAEAYPDPTTGAVALPTGYGADFAGFDINESQQSESVACYGAANYDPHRGSGTPHQSISVTGFAKYGASGKSPGFSMSASPAAGGAATFTVSTGVSMAGSYVVSQIRLSHSRLRAAVPLTFQLENSSDVTITWPVS